MNKVRDSSPLWYRVVNITDRKGPTNMKRSLLAIAFAFGLLFLFVVLLVLAETIF